MDINRWKVDQITSFPCKFHIFFGITHGFSLQFILIHVVGDTSLPTTCNEGNRLPQESNNVSCLNSRAIIEYIRRTKPDRVPELFHDLPEPWSEMSGLDAYLCDENNWIPSSLVVRLFETARVITGDPDIAFTIGFDSILHREFSWWQKIFVKIFSSPRLVLRRMNLLNTSLNSTKIVEVVSDSPGRAVIRWHWRDGIVASKDLCSYNKGIYSAIPTFWGKPAAGVEERSCQFEGAPYCETAFTWGLSWETFSGFFNRFFTRKKTLYSALEEIDKDKALLRQKFDELSRLNVELTDLNADLKQKVTMLKAINSATRSIVSVADTQKVLAQTMTPIIDVFGFDRAIIMLVDAAGENLEFSYGVGASMEALDKMRSYRIPLAREQNLMVRVLKRRKPVLIRDVKAAGLNPTNRILADFNPNSFIICPLIAEGEVIGILGADRREASKHLSMDDTEFLSIFANNIATVFLRARLDEELKTSYVSAVRALVQAIEEKDTYTRGHSERVSRIAVEVARQLGLPEMEIEYLRFGSILHDVGKIGIPESIVRSPKPLTDAEFKIIQKHPLKGVEILQPISFIQNHMYLIRNHHERWDGRGYPDKLSGEDIPLGAQIVATADAFDAMTSSRPYRKGMPPKQAAREINKSIGTQFSKKVAEAFLEVFESNRIEKI
jgi:putative nucleotidyltransferase with HDIG domain